MLNNLSDNQKRTLALAAMALLALDVYNYTAFFR